jgi:2-desacetyl-2-hydroxyethyl bacteriochlorophyllide A dehydrogenase
VRAAIYKGLETIEVEHVPDPDAGPDDVVVKVAACGICGSDLHTYLHGAFVEPGQVMGHEFVGEVVHVGERISGLAVGDRVTASPIVPCMECARCREGRYNLCGAAWANGIAYGRPGAFAEFVKIPSPVVGSNVFPLGPEVTDAAGALVEPLAVGVHAVRLVEPVQGATALVLGLGTIGLQVVQALRAHGAGRIIGIDLSARRVEAAAAVGAEAYDGSDGVASVLAGALAGGEEIDVVFECTGVRPAAQAALDVVRSGGTILVLALYDEPIALDPTVLVQREILLRGSIAYTSEDFQEAVELLAAGAALADPLITHREPLDKIGEAFSTQLRKNDSIKVLVEP